MVTSAAWWVDEWAVGWVTLDREAALRVAKENSNNTSFTVTLDAVLLE